MYVQVEIFLSFCHLHIVYLLISEFICSCDKISRKTRLHFTKQWSTSQLAKKVRKSTTYCIFRNFSAISEQDTFYTHLGTYFKLTIMRQHISVEPLRFLLTYYLNTYFIFLYYQYTFKERILRFQSIYRIKLKMYLLSVFENDTKQRKGARKGYTDFECFL